MFVKGKLNLFPERVKDENKIKKIFAQTIEKTQK
jgi:heterodisulfide reductase subunit C